MHAIAGPLGKEYQSPRALVGAFTDEVIPLATCHGCGYRASDQYVAKNGRICPLCHAELA